MLDSPQETAAPEPQPAKSRGCFFYGCITAIILAVLGALGIGAAVYSGLRYMRSFTSDTPANIPVYQPKEGEYEALRARMDAFKEAVDKGESGVELVLTADDMNAMIASDENMKDLKGKAYVRMDQDKLGVDVSFPLDAVPGCSGRYLNGAAGVKICMVNGLLMVTADEVLVNGKPLPEEFMAGLRAENLANEFNKKPENQELLRKVEDVQVEDSKLKLVSK